MISACDVGLPLLGVEGESTVSINIDSGNLPLVKVVGVSGSGKSTLVRELRRAGYNARPVSQEHSDVPNLWEQFDAPVALIFLYADLASQRHRRADVKRGERDMSVEMARLAHARQHADLRIDTSALSPDEVLVIVVKYLEHVHVDRGDQPLEPVPATGTAHKRSAEQSTRAQ